MSFNGTEYINMVALRGNILNDSPVSSMRRKVLGGKNIYLVLSCL